MEATPLEQPRLWASVLVTRKVNQQDFRDCTGEVTWWYWIQKPSRMLGVRAYCVRQPRGQFPMPPSKLRI